MEVLVDLGHVKVLHGLEGGHAALVVVVVLRDDAGDAADLVASAAGPGEVRVGVGGRGGVGLVEGEVLGADGLDALFVCLFDFFFFFLKGEIFFVFFPLLSFFSLSSLWFPFFFSTTQKADLTWGLRYIPQLP